MVNHSEESYEQDDQKLGEDGLIVYIPEQAHEVVMNTTLQDKSIRYSVLYKFPEDSILPRPNAVILDPYHKWNGHPKVSIEFKKLGGDNNLSKIYEALDLLNAKYEIREISLEHDVSIEILRITSESIRAMAYLSNLYEPYSTEVAQMFRAPLEPMLYWTLELYHPTITQDFGIWMAHWSSEDSHEIKLIAPQEPKVMEINGTCLAYQNYDYERQLEVFTSHYDKYIRDLAALKKQREVKFMYKNWTDQLKEMFFRTLLENKINELKSGLLAIMTEDKVIAERERIKYEKSLKVFDSPEQCQSYLSEHYSGITEVMESFNDQIRLEWRYLENHKQEFFDNVSKSSKDISTIIGTLVFDVTTGIMPSVALAWIGATISVTKISACVYSLASRHQVLDLSDKKAIERLDIKKFISEFVCKVSVCNANNFMSLTDSSREALAKIYAKYLYMALVLDKNQYTDASHFIDVQIDKMQNQLSLPNFKLADEIASLNLEFINGTRIGFYDYIGSQHQDQCYHRSIIADAQQEILFAGETTKDDNHLSTAETSTGV